MHELEARVGIIGGNGALGSAIAQALLTDRSIDTSRLIVSCRSGKAPALAAWPDINLVTDNQVLAEKADIIILSVPPAAFGEVSIDAGDKLVISVMAGISAAHIAERTGARRIVRAMSSPAAASHLAFSVWQAGASTSGADREAITALLTACGQVAEVPDEDQIDAFTALTGPVPGLLAYYAEAMADWAQVQGVEPDTADRAVRQLFLASGIALAESDDPPAAHVRAMIDYAGTTAAGLVSMKDSPLRDAIHDGLDAARRKAEAMGDGE